MEEALVAGESPDRSKQRESSAGTTPGTGEPVAETAAVSAAADPRAVFARTAVAEAPRDGDGDGADAPSAASAVPPEDSAEPDGADGSDRPDGPEGPDGSEDASAADEDAEGQGSGERPGEAQEGATGAGDAEDAEGDGEASGAADTAANAEDDSRLRTAVSTWLATEERDEADAAPEDAAEGRDAVDDATVDRDGEPEQGDEPSGVRVGAEEDEPEATAAAGKPESGDEEPEPERAVPAFGAAAGVDAEEAAAHEGQGDDAAKDEPEPERAVPAFGAAAGVGAEGSGEDAAKGEPGATAAGERESGDEAPESERAVPAFGAVAGVDAEASAADEGSGDDAAKGEPESDDAEPERAVPAFGAVAGVGAEGSGEDAAKGEPESGDEESERAVPAVGAALGVGAEGRLADGAVSEASAADEGSGDEPGSGVDAEEAVADEKDEASAPEEVAADDASKGGPSGEPVAPAEDGDDKDPAADAEATDGDEDEDRRPAWAAGPLPAEEKRDATRAPGTVAPPADKAAKKPAAKKPVDQPTTAIRLGRPGAERPVDQPTTQLKVGTAPEPSTRKPPTAPAAPTAPVAGASATETTAIPQIGPERTTQQPLPPKPPLDLLAELTNTPPPPDTLPRRVMRRVKIWTPVVVLLAIVLAIVQMVRPLPEPALVLTAQESHRFDGDPVSLPWPGEGQGSMDVIGIGTVDRFGEQKPVPIASVTKSMTAYVIMRENPLKPGEEGPMITIDALAEKEGGYDKPGQDESTLNNVKEGQKLSLRDALSAVMIPSANNIARLLARWNAGSQEAFVEKMNKTADELGMTNTTYTDPSGLKETTVSTADDQVKLGVAMMKMPGMVDITKQGSWKDPSGRIHYNYNTLVPYDGAIGIKTGSTTKAGGNLLFAATKPVDGETVTLVGAILGQHKPYILDTVNAVSKTAMLATQDALTSETILKKGDVVGYVDDRLGGRTPVVVSEDVKAVGWAGHEVKLTFDPKENLPHTAAAGTEVGSLTVGDGKDGAVTVPVQLQSDLAEPDTAAKLTRVA
ncbi:D-alanyl-D-alanine carboxypeptidase [Streptomyces sp. NPDC002640]